MVNIDSIAVVDSNPARRNLLTRQLYECIPHVEPYESLNELAASWPDVGLILIHDDDDDVRTALDLVLRSGTWIPVVAYAVDPPIPRIVDVIQLGATDYLGWPVSLKKLAERIELLKSRRASIAELRRRASRCQKLVDGLTDREREVLLGLVRGASNKTIARDLQISPRTIEIHRANMMGKLGVAYVGQAVSIALYASLEN